MDLINILIHEPIWKNRSVGIAERKIIADILVSIDYRDKRGELVFPGRYLMKREKALTYPTQMVRGTTLRIIPISDFEKVQENGVKIAEIIEDDIVVSQASPDQLNLF